MCYEDDDDPNLCSCSCAGCSLHVTPETPTTWRLNSHAAEERLTTLACQILGHKDLTGPYKRCSRCLECQKGRVETIVDVIAEMAYYSNRWAREESRAHAILKGL